MNDFSRSPSDYRPDPNGHLRRRKKEDNVPGAAIRECIENGEVTGEGHGKHRVKLRAKYGAVHYWVALDIRENLAVSCGMVG